MAGKRKIEEKYQRLSDADRSFDIRFWQEKPIAIFKAIQGQGSRRKTAGYD